MSTQLHPDDLAALYGPCDRAAEQHRIVTESHACDTCNGWGQVCPEGHWAPCLPCNGFGFISTEYRQEVA